MKFKSKELEFVSFNVAFNDGEVCICNTKEEAIDLLNDHKQDVSFMLLCVFDKIEYDYKEFEISFDELVDLEF